MESPGPLCGIEQLVGGYFHWFSANEAICGVGPLGMTSLHHCILVLSLSLARAVASVKPRVVVVGGGVGGLFAAAKLVKLGNDVMLLEQNSVCGNRLPAPSALAPVAVRWITTSQPEEYVKAVG